MATLAVTTKINRIASTVGRLQEEMKSLLGDERVTGQVRGEIENALLDSASINDRLLAAHANAEEV